MKLPLRTFATFAAAIFGLCAASPAFSGSPIPAPNPPGTDQTRPAPPTPVGDRHHSRPPAFLHAHGGHQPEGLNPTMCCLLLARNVFMQGYQRGTPTEFLLLLDRYVQQARELQILAGTANTIRVANCDDAGTLVQILGYRAPRRLRHQEFLP